MGRAGIKPRAVNDSWQDHQPGEITGTMNHADNLDAVHELPVQDEIRLNRKIAQIRRNVGPFWAKTGLVPEKNEGLFDVIKYAVRSTHIVVGNEQPDVNQVFFGLRCALNDGNDPSRVWGLGVLRCSLSPPGLGLDGGHIGVAPRPAREPLLPETTKRFEVFLFQCATAFPVLQCFAKDVAAGRIVATFDRFAHDRQHLRRQRNTDLFNVCHVIDSLESMVVKNPTMGQESSSGGNAAHGNVASLGRCGALA